MKTRQSLPLVRGVARYQQGQQTVRGVFVLEHGALKNADRFIHDSVTIDECDSGCLERLAQRLCPEVPCITGIDEGDENVCINQDLFRGGHRRDARCRRQHHHPRPLDLSGDPGGKPVGCVESTLCIPALSPLTFFCHQACFQKQSEV